MTKFSPDRFPPGFFDLPRSAGTTLPLDEIEAWTHSAQTLEAAREILGPHTLRGIVVASDSSGLTRMTRERPLIDILAMLSHPKELIHAYGCAVAGRAIGVWAADNTQMFYDASIDPAHVVAMLKTVMDRIAAECEVSIGMAAHVGEFFELAGAVYGRDADRVESVAEEHTEGGELVVSDALMDRLPEDHGFTFTPRADLEQEFGGMCRVTDGPVIRLDATDMNYPAPFSSDFTAGLVKYARTRRDSVAPRKAYEDLAVVLIKREPEIPDVPEIAVLNDLSLTAATKRIGTALIDELGGSEIKNAGLLSIYTFERCDVAVAFARRIRDALGEQRIQCRIGIDAGPVLVFELGPGAHDIAGSAVNIASKLAEDVGEFGKIQISDTVAERAGTRKERPTITFDVSGVRLRGYDL